MASIGVCGTQVSARRAAFSSSARKSVVVRASTTLPKQFKGVKPVGDRVFVKVDKEEAKSIGGVLLPASSQKKSTGGTIVAVGDATAVKAGDRVVYSKFAGTDIEVGENEHVLLKEEDVIGILGKTEKIASMKPLGDRVMIQAAKNESKTTGGVLLAGETGEKPNFGKVVAVGEGRKKEDSEEWIKPNVSVGQTVMYSKYSGSEFDEDDESYIVVRESDILAALE